MQRLTWTGIAMHRAVARLSGVAWLCAVPEDFAEKLYNRQKLDDGYHRR